MLIAKRLFVFCVVGLVAFQARAYDSEIFRPYLHFRSAEFNTVWGVNDGWGFALGANLNRHFGIELAIDTYEHSLYEDVLDGIGEEAVFSLVPQMRLRYPFANDRWTVYGLFGLGPGFLQFNDRKGNAFGAEIEADGVRLVTAVGVGLEYFVADNVTFNLEGKYMWIQDLEGSVDGRRYDIDMSAPLLTMGVRAYFIENHKRPLLLEESAIRNRFYFGVRYGGSVLLDDQWAEGVSLSPEVSANFSRINDFGSMTLGVDVGRDWGIELSGDFTEYTLNVDPYGAIGEYSVYTIVPHLRLRWPIKNGRWVPYVMAGMGVTYAEFNDRKPVGLGVPVAASGFSPAVSAGAGFEYFIARNFSVNTDVRYLYTWDQKIEAANVPERSGDFSSINFYFGFRLYLWEF
ncbi:MAG: outer membrane beta-barrel protein [Verrucomicrobia bacterium]|nr:outer membrane beta-barrel protein [Verrucomicrobiota bacterium]